jgi:hypothetical protein
MLRNKSLINHQQFYHTHIGVHFKPLNNPSQSPVIILMLRCRMGNQLHQIWVAEYLRHTLKRPLHVVIHSNSEGTNVFQEDLFSLIQPEKIEFYHYPSNRYKLVDPCTTDPIKKVLDHRNILPNHDVVLNIFGECWSYTEKFEDFIRSLYRIHAPLAKTRRIVVHLRLGDVAHIITQNDSYVEFVVATVRRILKKEQEYLPIFLLAEEKEHEYTTRVQKRIDQEVTNLTKRDDNVEIVHNDKPTDAFKEIMASSHIIASNSTFTFWASFLADPKETEVYIGVSSKQPAPFRNVPLYLSGGPANFHVYDLDHVSCST